MTHPRDALVGNASDRKQLDAAAKKEREREFQGKDDLKRLMQLPEFRRFIWKLLKFTKVFESIWTPNAQIHYNSGQQDVGHWVQGEIVASTPDEYFTMIKENGTNAS